MEMARHVNIGWQTRFEPLHASVRRIPVRWAPAAFCMPGILEELFEILFGASGRINRAKYWRSVLLLCIAGPMVAVTLFTAVGIAAPLLIITVVLFLIPWVLWGLSITTERLHDRNKSAWWLVTFYLAPGLLAQLTRTG
jgi:uncharacterized membrane protein YhaH (DUF805 family)